MEKVIGTIRQYWAIVLGALALWFVADGAGEFRAYRKVARAKGKRFRRRDYIGYRIGSSRLYQSYRNARIRRGNIKLKRWRERNG